MYELVRVSFQGVKRLFVLAYDAADNNYDQADKRQ